jgi:RHS repeat-associated protein
LQDVGIYPYTTSFPVENGFIDGATGRLHLELPLASVSQRGGSQFKAALVYDSNITGNGYGFGTGYANVQIPNNESLTPSLTGWRLVTSADSGSISGPRLVDVGNCQGFVVYDWLDNWVWIAPEGTSHRFGVRTQQYYPTPCNHNNPPVGIPNAAGYTNDSSGYYISITNYGNATVYAPDGRQVYPNVKDSNGNTFAASGSNIVWPNDLFNANEYPYYSSYFISSHNTFVDSAGRSVVTGSRIGDNVSFNVLNSQGSTSTYTLVTGMINVCAQFSWIHNAYPSGAIRVLKEVDLPDGTKYSFAYDSDNSRTDCSANIAHFGDLKSMTLPTGAQVTYAFVNYTFGMQSNGYPVMAGRMFATRTTPDSTIPWTYAPTWDPTTCSTGAVGCLKYLTVTKPNNDTDLYTFTLGIGGNFPTQGNYYGGTVSPANLLATQTQTWDTSWHKVTSATTTLPVPGGTSVNQTSHYNWDFTYGNLTQRLDWNFGNPTTNPADRTTTFTYLLPYSGTNIVNRPLTVAVTNASGTTVSQTVNCYDYSGGCGGSAFADTGNVTNHDTNFGTSYTFRGDLTQTKRLISGTTNFLAKSMTFDTTGQVRTETDWSNLSTHTTTYDYTDHFVDDNLTNSEPLTTHSLSQATGGYATTVTAPISAASMTYTYYYGTGQRSSGTDANSRIWYSHFGDPLNRQTSIKQPNGGWTYSPYPTAAKTPLDVGTGITSPTLSTTCTGAGDCRHDQTQLEALGRVSHQVLVSDPDTQTTIDTIYDSNGRMHSVSNPHRSSSNPTDGTETYSVYDGLDRKLQVTRADGSVAYISYGAAVSSNGGRSSQICSGYGVGYPVLNIDEAGHKRQSWTDGFGRLIEVDEPDSTGTLSAGTCYAYDQNNNLIGVLSPGGTESTCIINSVTYNRCFSYDLDSRLLSATNPESGTISYVYDQDTNCPLPNSFPSQLVSKTDARGNRTCMQYDYLNRITQKNYPSSTTRTITYTYDSTSCLDVSPCYNLSRRTGMSDGSGQTNWSYDAVGNALEEKRTIGSVTKYALYTYNRDSSIATIQYPSGNTVTYQPSDAQRALSVTGSSINYATGAHYAPPGELASVTNGGALYFTSIYNNRLQPCWQYATTGTALAWSGTLCTGSSSTGNVLDLKYNFNWGASDNGNVVGVTNNRDSARSQTFAYDNLNRLSTAQSASTHATSPTECWDEVYSFDAVGNLLSIQPSTNSAYIQCKTEGLNIGVNTHNQISSPSGFVYDLAGSLTTVTGSASYTYNAESQMSNANGTGYIYNGDGQRVEKTTSGTPFKLYWYDRSGNVLDETDQTGSTTNSSFSEYVFFGGKRIARRDSSGNVFYYFADQLGTSRVIEEIPSGQSTATLCYDYDFYPFGAEIPSPPYTNTCPQNYKFTGKERDTESSLDDFGARYYSSQYGKFVTPDWSSKVEPVPYAKLEFPQTLNLYTYADNNPIERVDVDGHGSYDEYKLDGSQTMASEAMRAEVMGNNVFEAMNNFVSNTFALAMQNYPTHEEYGTATPGSSGMSVGQLIGGNAEQQFGQTDSCALRLSYALNQAGVAIPHIDGQTVSGKGHHSWYFFRASDLEKFVENRFGGTLNFSGKTMTSWKSSVGSMSGVVHFDVHFIRGTAVGHITLYNGATGRFADRSELEDYTNGAADGSKTTRIQFTAMP